MLLLSKFKISGHSMEPFIKDNDKILISNIFYLLNNPRVNDVIVFYDKNKKIKLKKILKIKNEKYFVGGDNKNDSLDSRSFGYIQREQILGKYICKI